MAVSKEQPLRPYVQALGDAVDSGDIVSADAVQTFDTVAEMQAATHLTTGMTCHTNGFHSAGDGGAAYYAIGTTMANALTSVSVTDGLYANIMSGTFILQSDVTLSSVVSVANITLDLNGHTITSNAATAHVLRCDNVTIKNGTISQAVISMENIAYACIAGRNIHLQNVTLEGNTGYAAENPVDFFIAENCVFNDWYQDIRALTADYINNVKLINCEFPRNCNHSTPYEASSKVVISSGLSEWQPTFGESDLANKGTGLTIEGCYFGPTNQRAVLVRNMKNVRVSNVVSENNDIPSTQVGGSHDVMSFDLCDGVVVENVKITGSGENSLDILACKNVSVSDCTLVGSPYYGIAIDLSDAATSGSYDGDYTALTNENVKIDGCTISTNVQSGRATTPFALVVSAGDNITITNTSFSGTVAGNDFRFMAIAFKAYSGHTSTTMPIGNVTVRQSTIRITDLSSMQTGTNISNCSISGTQNFKSGTRLLIDESSAPIVSKDLTQAGGTTDALFPFHLVADGAAYKVTPNNELRRISPFKYWDNQFKGLDYVGAYKLASGISQGAWRVGSVIDNYLTPASAAQGFFTDGNIDLNQTSGKVFLKIWNA